MTISNKLRSQITSVMWITVAWTFLSLLQFLTVYAATIEMELDTLKINMPAKLTISIFRGILGGLVGGSSIVFLWEYWLRNKPYGWTLKSTLLLYIVIFLLVSIPTDAFYQSKSLNENLFAGVVWKAAVSSQFSFTTLVPFIFWLTVVILTTISLQVNDKYGPGVFRKFLLGRYFSPHKEERIFMFLDLRSSTATAEKLGEEKYFSFLKDVFKYSTPPILKHDGEIYQYVGDEIVISWKLNNGLVDNNCIQCFFAIQASLEQNRQHFIDSFKTYPEFKAGIHYGHVMAGEIGIVKREIAFSGDVLNTTARIQSKCNDQGVDLLISETLINRLYLEPPLISKKIGNMKLRGKEKLVTLYTISANHQSST